MATLADVCRRTGLSTATVSRVVNNSDLVRDDTRDRVQEAIRDLGYRPTYAARMLARQKTETLAVLARELDSGFYAEVLRGADAVASERGYHLIVGFAHDKREAADRISEWVGERRADGVVLLNVDLPMELLGRLHDDNACLAMVGRPISKMRFPHILIDNVRGADLAYSHLLEHGGQRIAVLKGPEDNFDSAQRLAGCQLAARRANWVMREDCVWPGDFSEASGYQAIRERLGRGERLPDALFAFNDSMALGVMSALREAGRRVPEDLRLIGFDDVATARHVGLTTVSVPLRHIGREAATLALDMAEGRAVDVEHVVKTSLTVRESCGCERRVGAP